MSQAIPITHFQGMEAIELRAPDGARATVLLHGGHLTSWIPSGSNAEQLYLSPKTAFANGQAIRGGVPVCFPQFASRGPLQKHGFARNKPWQLISAEQGADDALAVLRLTDDAASRMFWPHNFELELSVRVSGRDLQIELACENTGDAPFEFTAALHSYLGLLDLDESSLQGLAGCDYLDSVDGVDKTQRVDLLLPSGELDRIYKDIHKITQDLTLQEQRGAAQRRVLIQQQGFEDAVVWNPGAAKCASLADMPADGYKHMLCVEAAAIMKPIHLEAGEGWVGMQSLTLA